MFGCLLFGAFTFLRSSSGRSYLVPLGYSSLSWVANGNKMVSRVVLLIMIVAYRGATFVLEQPRGSLMRRHPRWVGLIRKLLKASVPVFDLGVFLGSFGAPSPKPLVLSSNNEAFLNALHRPWDKCKFLQSTQKLLLVKKQLKDGKRHVTGIKKHLMASQCACVLFL